jgi:hydrophobe/amphiphile efflux-3 (HAE3) family protein
MNKNIFAKIAQFIEKHPIWIMLLVIILTAGSIWGITKIQLVTEYSTFISVNSKPYQDNEKFESNFGSDSIIVLFSGDVTKILESENLSQLQQIENEIAGNANNFITIGPATVIESALQQQKAELEQNQQAQPAVNQNTTSSPPDFSITNNELIKQIIFDAENQIRPNFEMIFPDDQHAILITKMVGGLTLEEKEEFFSAIKTIAEKEKLSGIESSVTGTMAMLLSMKEEISKSMLILLLISVVLMVLVLGTIFRVRWRLLPLPVILIATLWTFGVMGWFSIPLTIVTMALIPILVGLGIDYAIQFHNRYEEEMHRGETSKAAIIDAIKHISPAILIALLASIFGFASLFISEVPMIKDFSLMLVIGVVCSFVAGLFIINSILYQRDKNISYEKIKGATTNNHRGPLERIITKITVVSIKNPIIIFILAASIAGFGFFVLPKIPLQTDFEKFVPQNSPAVQELQSLRETIETTSQINIMVENGDVTSPQIIQWIEDFGNKELTKYPEIKSASSIADIISASSGGTVPTDHQQIKTIIGQLPKNATKTTINSDHSLATITFGVEHLEISKLKDLVESIEKDIQESVLPDITATPAGLEVLSAKTLDTLTANRHEMIILGIILIFIGLLIVFRSLLKALLPIIPIVLVIGWSNMVMYLFNIEYNPLTITFGALILGVGSEYTILLMQRYYEERKKDQLPKEAMIAASVRIGKAIATSAFTTIGGFVALVASSFIILRSFGFMIVIDLLLILISTLFVLPPLIVILDGWWNKVKSKRSQAIKI